MSNVFTRSVLGEFEKIGRGRPNVISEWEDVTDFGNAHVTLEVDGLKLHVVNDRGVQTVEVGLRIVNPVGPLVHPALIQFKDGVGEPTCPLEVLAVASGWIDQETLVEHYGLNGDRSESFGETEALVAPPFYELSGALSLFRDEEKWVDLVEASKSHDLQLKAGSIEEELQFLLLGSLETSPDPSPGPSPSF